MVRSPLPSPSVIGRLLTALAETTPGIRARRSGSAAYHAIAAGVSYRALGSATVAIPSPSVRNPGSTPITSRKLRSRSPAPERITSEIATCSATSDRCSSRRSRPAVAAVLP